MIPLFLAWVGLFLVISLLGLAFYTIIHRIIGRQMLVLSLKWYELFWLGFIFLISLLQFYSLLLPINKFFWLLLLVICFVTLAFFYSKRRVSLQFFQNGLIKRNNVKLFVFIGVFLILTAGYNASRKVVWYDTNMYHLNAVRWVTDYKVIPGLVHVDPLYGFNSSFFLYAGATDISYFTAKSSHIALSLLVMVLIFQWLYVIFLEKNTSAFERLFCLGTFPLILHKAWANELPSLSTDLAALVIFFVLCLFLIKRTKLRPLILAGLGGIILTFKLSALIVSFLVLVYILWLFYKSKTRVNTLFFASMLMFFLVLSGFIVRNAIVSGWLLYPFSYFGNLNLPWSASVDKVETSILVIKSWARVPGVYYGVVSNMTFIDWFRPWFEKFKAQIEFRLILVSILAVILALSFDKITKFLKANLSSFLILVAINIVSLGLWFYAAPDLRFGSQFFWAAFATSMFPLLCYFVTSYKKNGWLVIYIATFFLSIHMAEYFPKVTEIPEILTLKKEESLTLQAVVASPGDEVPPLILWVPVSGDQCGNSQLPCSTEERSIRQIVPGDISKGFLPPSN